MVKASRGSVPVVAPDRALEAVEVLADRFRLIRRVGRGSTANVYHAVDDVIGRDVAIKVLDPQLFLDPQYVQRFEREAVASGRLCHPNIVSMYDLGFDDRMNTYFLVMQFIHGRNLAEVRELLMKRPYGERLEVLSEILPGVQSGLEHCHARGVVHRDIKPHNILIADDGVPYVSDFGIALVMDLSHATLPGYVPGTPYYMAPEQLAGLPVDARSDIYALGSTFRYFLQIESNGQAPRSYSGVRRHAALAPLPAGLVPAGVERVLFRAIASRPEDRYATVAEFLEELQLELGIRRPAVIQADNPEISIDSIPDLGWKSNNQAAQNSDEGSIRVRNEHSTFRHSSRIQGINTAPRTLVVDNRSTLSSLRICLVATVLLFLLFGLMVGTRHFSDEHSIRKNRIIDLREF